MRTKNAEFIIPWQFAIAIREGKASEEQRYRIKSLRLLNKYLDGPLKVVHPLWHPASYSFSAIVTEKNTGK